MVWTLNSLQPRVQSAKKKTATFQQAAEQRSASSSRRGSHTSITDAPAAAVTPPQHLSSGKSMGDVFGASAALNDIPGPAPACAFHL
eukprot:550123-Rhodomonas_salina.2